MKKLRWGVLGTGRIISKGGKAIHEAANSEWIGVAGRTPENSRQAADAYSVPRAYGSYQELLDDPDIEAVYIALLNHLHAEWAVKALRAGKHVLLEKPFSLNGEEAERIRDASLAAGKQVMEAHVWRYQQAHSAAKEKIRMGEIGTVCEFRGHFSFVADRESTRWVKEWGGGSLYDVGCYPLAWCLHYIEAVPEAVDARMVLSPSTGVDQRFAGTLYFPDGRTGFISSALDMGLGSFFEVLGTKGRLTAAVYVQPNESSITLTCGGVTEQWTTDRIDPYKLQVEAFADALLAGRAVPNGPDDACTTMRLIDSLMTSAHEGRRVWV